MIDVSASKANGHDTDAADPVGFHSKEAQDHSEGIVARTIEEQTAKLPSDIFLWGARTMAQHGQLRHTTAAADSSGGH